MRVAGSASWRFAEGNSQLLHLALYVRDAAALAVPTAADVPPPLTPAVPAEILPATDRAEAAIQWLAWWRRLVESEVHEARLRRVQSGQDGQARLRAMSQRQRGVFDPPEFETLTALPELRALAVASFRSALAWCNKPRRRGPVPSRPGAFAWPVVRGTVEAVAAERGVPVSDLDATAAVLDVQGAWSYLAGPGFALCSPAVAADPQASRVLLHEVFDSVLN